MGNFAAQDPTTLAGDLHVHSAWSDGEWTPRALVKAARRAHLGTMALTDHDTVDGFAEAWEAGQELGVEVLTGVELSIDFAGDFHLLAYGFAAGPSELSILMNRARGARRERAEKIVERLDDLGVPISLEAVVGHAGQAAIGRPHIARALLEAHHVSSFREAFDRYLGDGREACVAKPKVQPAEAIAAIHRAGGVAVAAHPGAYGPPEHLDPLLELGLDGVEIDHPLHRTNVRERFDAYAIAHGMIRTGGSDFHGPGRGLDVGACGAPAEWLEALRERIAMRTKEEKRIG